MTENTSAITLAELQQKYTQLEQSIDTIHENTDAFFLCSNAVIIFFMQCGFAFLEAGAVRSKNTTNILVKNLLDSCIVIVAFWATGYAFAYGGEGRTPWDHLIGNTHFFLINFNNYPHFFFQFVFAATAATIVSGAVAERCEFITYIVYCSSISALVYPVLAHWGWSTYGWFNTTLQFGGKYITYQDFAGSGLIHLCGGSISFIAAKIVGPRIGRFPKDDGHPHPELQGHSLPFAALGGFILMFGFLAFNGGSAGEISAPGTGNMVALAMTNTILCGALAALTYLLIHYAANGKWTCLLTINAALTGMVAVCAGCNIMMPWACVFTGPGAGIIYLWLSKLVVKLKIDDPLDAFAVHAGGGAWGLIAARIIGKGGVAYAIVGAIDGSENSGHAIAAAFVALGWQCVCAIAIVLWSISVMIPVFWVLKKLGKLRVSPEVEIKGLDIFKHGEAAYPIHAYARQDCIGGFGQYTAHASEWGHANQRFFCTGCMQLCAQLQRKKD
uniref:Ammonium transporter n=1 Tax=Panagrellus redivivus TaxID=6233 RepID=A0A7E4VGM1_PANRE